MIRALAVLALLVLLAGCGGPAPAASQAPTVDTQPTAVLAPAETAFVDQVHRIAPRIVGSDERLAARAANTCSSLDGPHSKAVDQAVERFSSGSYTVTRAEAEQLVEAARTTVCNE